MLLEASDGSYTYWHVVVLTFRRQLTENRRVNQQKVQEPQSQPVMRISGPCSEVWMSISLKNLIAEESCSVRIPRLTNVIFVALKLK